MSNIHTLYKSKKMQGHLISLGELYKVVGYSQCVYFHN